MAYTYFISFDSGANYSQFYPATENKITWTPYQDQIFLRPVIDEIKISVRNNATVFATLLSNFFDKTKFGTNILIKIKSNNIDTYFFRSSISDTTIDTEKGTCLFTPDYDDDYQDIIDIYTKKCLVQNIYGSLYNIYNWEESLGTFVNVDFDTFSDISNTVTWTASGEINLKARMGLTGLSSSINGDVVRVLITSSSGGGELRLLNSAYALISLHQYVSDGLITITSTANSISYLEFIVDPEVTSSGSFTYAVYVYKSYKQMRGLRGFVEDLIYEAGKTITVKSTFLFGSTLPSVAPTSISTYVSANPTKCYVTEALKIFNDNITLLDLDYTYSTEFETTIKDMMIILWIKFRCYWYIDSDGYFRIEHEKYFRSWSAQSDLTSATYTKYKPETDALIYVYQKSELYNQIELTETASTDDNFKKAYVNYDMIKTSSKTVSYTAVNLICDTIDYLSTTDDREILFMSSFETIGTKKVMHMDFGVIDNTVLIQNIYMSWAYVLTKYWKYFGEADSATINGSTTLTLTHVKEFLKQSNVRFYYNGTLNWYQPFTLINGIGWANKIELSLESGFYSIDVGFDPYA